MHMGTLDSLFPLTPASLGYLCNEACNGGLRARQRDGLMKEDCVVGLSAYLGLGLAIPH